LQAMQLNDQPSHRGFYRSLAFAFVSNQLTPLLAERLGMMRTHPMPDGYESHRTFTTRTESNMSLHLSIGRLSVSPKCPPTCVIDAQSGWGPVWTSVETLEGRMLLSNTWFVSPGGSNSNPGTIAAPFQTIQQAANEAQAGNTVMIETGVYHETVTVPNSGAAGAPIVFELTTTNQSPSTGRPDTNWVNTGGSIYSAPMSWDLGAGNNQVFVDGTMTTRRAGRARRWMCLTPPSPASIPSQHRDDDHGPNPGPHAGGRLLVGAPFISAPAMHGSMQSATITASGPGFVTFTGRPTASMRSFATAIVFI